MTCPPYNDRLCEIQYLLNGLNSFNVNSFLEVLIATLVGAVLAFLGAWLIHRRALKSESDQSARNALIAFLRWMSKEGLPARSQVDIYTHLATFHPNLIGDYFPSGPPQKVNRQVELAELQRLSLSAPGIIRELVEITKSSYEDDSGTDARVAYVGWTALSDVAGDILVGKVKDRNDALDAYREAEQRLSLRHNERFSNCALCLHLPD